MNANDGSDFRQKINSRLRSLDAEDALGRDGQGIVALDQQSVGRLSRMDALQNQAMAKATQARRNMERTRLSDALDRIETGEFGHCEDCGEDIPRGRLELDLAATRCVSCASG